MQHRDDFTERIDCHPEPEHMSMAAEPCPQFVELAMRQVEVLEDAVVECRTMFTRTGQPTRDRGMAVAKDPYCRCDIDPFRKRGQHLRNALGCRFEAVQRRHPEGTRGAC
jgi:hypothetical protein